MRLFLGSGGFNPESRRKVYVPLLQKFLGPIKEVLFVPYALHDYDKYTKMMNDAPHHDFVKFVGIHKFSDPLEAIHHCQAIFIGGGNTFRLLNTLQTLKLIPAIQKRVRMGLPYLGVSAGTNVACPTIKTTNDMPIVQPQSLNAMALVNFQINPHYFSGPIFLQHKLQHKEELVKYGGETRDDRIMEFLEMNHVPVLGLHEGCVLIGENQRFQISGEGGARLFKRNSPVISLNDGAVFSAL